MSAITETQASSKEAQRHRDDVEVSGNTPGGHAISSGPSKVSTLFVLLGIHQYCCDNVA